MYTAIIPTMLKTGKWFPKLVEDLQNSEYVDEIIIIDNSGNLESSLPPHPKQKYICEGKNTGCNPAWNKGVELAKNELLVICNDDVNFDPIILGALTSEVVEEAGIIGMGEGNWDGFKGIPFTYEGQPYLEEWKSGVNDTGWASLLMLKKWMWIPIPEDLIVWYGDNFIKDINPIKKSILRGFRLETEMSSTTDLPILSDLKKQDGINWIEHFKNRDKWKDYQFR